MGISHGFYRDRDVRHAHIVMLVVVDYAHNQSGLFRGFHLLSKSNRNP